MASLRTVCSIGLQAFPRTQPAARTVLKQANWMAAQQSRRPFCSSTILGSRPFRSSQQQVPPEYNQPPPKEPLGSSSATLIVGSIIAGCAGLFGYQQVQAMEFKQNGSKTAYAAIQRLRKHFVLSWEAIRDGRYYVLLTHTFAHSNIYHLVFNMFALWGFGRTICSWYGLPTFAIIWVGSAVLGGILQLGYWQKFGRPGIEYQAIGASGAIFGLMSALSFVAPQLSVSLMFIPMSLRFSMVISAALSLGAIKEGWLPWLGHVDHLGGMAFGFVWWLVALRRGRIGRIY